MNDAIITKIMAYILVGMIPYILNFFQKEKDEREMAAFLNSLKITTFITAFILIFIGLIYTDFDVLSIPTVFVFGVMISMFISTYILYRINISQKDILINFSTSSKIKICKCFRIVIWILIIISLSCGKLLNKIIHFNRIQPTVTVTLIFLLIIINSLYPLKKMSK